MAFGYCPFGLDPDVLVGRAIRTTGLGEFSSLLPREGLWRLTSALQREARLSIAGRFIAGIELQRVLSNRLRLEAAWQANPALLQRPVEAPLFITGLPRSGTTLFHRLLAVDPAHRAPLTWETMWPVTPSAVGWRGRNSQNREVRRTGPDRQIAAAKRRLACFRWLAPGLLPIHEVGACLPQECVVLMAPTLASYEFPFAYTVPSYADWLGRQDLRASYDFYRRTLQYLQGPDTQGPEPRRRWVLKAPAHLFGLDALLSAFPDARIVQLHRHPLTVTPSWASLVVTLRGAFSRHAEPRAIAQEQAALWAAGAARAVAIRDRQGAAGHIVDLTYDELLRDPLAAVRRIYRAFGLTLTADAQAAMRRYLAVDGARRKPAHRYSLEQFGLDRDEELQRFAPYCARFGFGDGAPWAVP